MDINTFFENMTDDEYAYMTMTKHDHLTGEEYFQMRKKEGFSTKEIDKKPWEQTPREILNSTPEGKELIEKYGMTKEGIDQSSKKFNNMTKEEWRQFQINNPIGEINFKKLDQ